MPSAGGAYLGLNSSKNPFIDEQASYGFHFFSSSRSLKMLKRGFLSIGRA
jgi:hypothetical protein